MKKQRKSILPLIMVMIILFGDTANLFATSELTPAPEGAIPTMAMADYSFYTVIEVATSNELRRALGASGGALNAFPVSYANGTTVVRVMNDIALTAAAELASPSAGNTLYRIKKKRSCLSLKQLRSFLFFKLGLLELDQLVEQNLVEFLLRG